MKNKVLFIVMLAMFTVVNRVSAWDGAGTESDPFLLNTYNDLLTLSNDVASGNSYSGTYFRLMNSIDFNGSAAGSWQPIGLSNLLPFSGHFDGNHQMIRNLYINNQTSIYTGFFGYAENGSIKNLNLTNVDITSAITVDSYVGGICAYSMSEILNCSTSGNISAQISNNEVLCIGGICGSSRNKIESCRNTASISSNTSTARINIGGICGYISNYDLSKCVNLGMLTNSSNDCYGGGICGYAYLSNISYCINAGKIETVANNANVGGVCGFCDATVSNSINMGNLVSNIAVSSSIGGISGFSANVVNCYFDRQMCNQPYGIGNVSTSATMGRITMQMVGNAMSTAFDDASNWLLTEGMYPQLIDYQNTDLSIVAATPIFLSNTQTIDAVSFDFTIGTQNAVSWTNNNNKIFLEADSAAVVATNDPFYGDLIVSRNNTSKVIQINVQELGNCLATILPDKDTLHSCVGDDIQLSAGMVGAISYTWIGPGGFYSDNQTLLFENLQEYHSGDYVVTANSGDCISRDTITLNVKPIPTAVFLVSSNTSCNAPFNGQISINDLSNGTTFSWTVDGVDWGNTTPITELSSGNHTLLITSDLGCSNTYTQLIEDNATNLNVSISGNNNLCIGDDATITANALHAISYSWSGPNGFTSNSQTLSLEDVTFSDAGTYTVFATDENNCQATNSIYINVNSLPVPTIFGDTEICVGESTILESSGGISYLWSTGSSASAITVQPTETTTYSVTASNVSGCTNTTSVEVQVVSIPSTPQAIVTNNDYCVGTPNGSITITSPISPNYQYSIDGINYYTGAVFANLSAGIYTVSVKNLSGCASTAIYEIQEAVAEDVQITGNTNICSGESTILTASGGEDYSWNTGATTPAISIAPLSTTIYTVTVTNSFGCADTESVTVTVNPNPATALVSTSNTRCLEPFNGSILAENIVGGSNFNWTINGENHGTPTVVSGFASGNYTVVTTNAEGCSTTDVVFVDEQIAPLEIEITGDTSLCTGETTTLSATYFESAVYQWTGPNGFTSAMPMITVSSANAGVYSVVVTYGNCVGTATKNVVSHSFPTVTMIPTSNTKCVVPYNGQITLSSISGGTNHSWTLDGISQGNVNPITAVTPGNHIVVVTNSEGCSITREISIDNNTATPNITISGTNQTCRGEEIVLTATGGASYVWNTGAITPVITVAPETETTYNVTATDAFGCVGQDTHTINIDLTPRATFTVEGNSNCNAPYNGEIHISDLLNGITFTWVVDGVYLNNTTPVTGLSGGNHHIVITNELGCSDEFIVNVPNTATDIQIGIEGDHDLCFGDNTTLTAIAENATSYLWTGPNGFLSNSQTIILANVSFANAGTYTVTVVDASNCEATNSIYVNVGDLPIAEIAGNTSVCYGENITLSAMGGVRYLWSTGATTSSITVSPTETTTYSVIVYNTSDCADEESITVNVIQIPEIVTTVSNNEYCTGVPNGSIVVNAPVGAEYQYSLNGVTYQTAHYFNQLESGNYTLYVKNAHGCVSTELVVIEDVISINPEISGNTIICRGESTILNASGGEDYLWNTGATTPAISVAPLSTTTYSVLVTDEFGCSESVSVEVVVRVLPQITIVGDTTICQGESTVLNASYSEASSYLWTGPNGFVSNDPIITACSVNAGIYTVVVNDGFCDASASVTVTSNTVPLATFTSIANTMCVTPYNGGIQITNITGGTNHTWSVDGGNFNNVNPITGLDEGRHEIIITSNEGCAHTYDIAVAENISTPTVNIFGNTLICSGESTVLTATGGVSYVWSNGATTNEITVSPTISTTYSVIVTDARGCVAEAAIDITVYSHPTATFVTAANTNCNSPYNGEIFIENLLNGISFTWEVDGTNYGSITPISGLSDGPHEVTITNQLGCSHTYTVVVPNRVANIQVAISGENKVCYGDDVVLTAVTAAIGEIDYRWSGPHGFSAVGQSITLPNATFETSGTYTVSIENANACEAENSVYVGVSDLPVAVVTEDTEICFGESAILSAAGGSRFLWSTGEVTHSIFVSPTETTSYSVRVFNSSGCFDEEIIEVVVHDNPAVPVVQIVDNTACVGTPNGSIQVLTPIGVGLGYSIDGNNYQSANLFSNLPAGEYTVYVKNSTECITSTITEIADVNNVVAAIEGTNLICSGETITLTASGGNTYLWGDGETTSSIEVMPLITTTYTVMATDNLGCFDTETITVYVNDSVVIAPVNIDVCDSYIWTWGDVEEYDSSGLYRHVFEGGTWAGCDSIVYLNLNVYPSSDQIIIADICMGETYNENGFYVQTLEPGVISRTQNLTSIYGCDSVVNLVLNVRSEYSGTDALTICSTDLPYVYGDIITFDASAISQIVPVMFETIYGCDSLVTLNLIVNQGYNLFETISICEDELPFTFSDTTFLQGTTSGIYSLHYLTTEGCDSIVNVNLTVNDIYTTINQMTICENDLPFVYENTTIPEGTTSGYFPIVYQSVYGCDSVFVIDLTVNPSYENNIEEDVCVGETYNNYGFVIPTSEVGVITETRSIISIFGCDSIVNLTLNVRPTYSHVDDITICSSELPYNFSGFTFNAGGTYNYVNSQTIYGCDSIRTLNLTVNESFAFEEEMEICVSELPLTYADTIFDVGTTSGIYPFEYETILSCDSIINLVMTVNSTYEIADAVTLCSDEFPFVYGNTTFYEGTTTGVYPIVYQTIHGCDSIINLSLTVNGNYNVQTDLTLCLDELPYNFGNIVIPVGSQSGLYTMGYQTVTGCDSIINISLTVNPSYEVFDTLTISEGDLPYDYFGQILTEGGDHQLMFYTTFGCDSLIHLNLNTVVGLIAVEDNRQIELYPNPIEKNQKLTIKYDFTDAEKQNLMLEVYNASGLLIKTYEPKQYPIEIFGIETTGSYTIRISTGIGSVLYGKFIVR